MAVPFSRSLRSLGADRYRGAVLGLVSAAVLLLAWTLWFLGAEVAVHERSDRVTVTASDTLLASFSDTAFARIRVGQRGHLHPSDDPTARPIEILVADSQARTRRHGNQARLAVLDTSAIPLPSDVAYTARITVETVSPARLLMRASGLQESTGNPR